MLQVQLVHKVHKVQPEVQVLKVQGVILDLVVQLVLLVVLVLQDLLDHKVQPEVQVLRVLEDILDQEGQLVLLVVLVLQDLLDHKVQPEVQVLRVLEDILDQEGQQVQQAQQVLRVQPGLQDHKDPLALVQTKVLIQQTVYGLQLLVLIQLQAQQVKFEQPVTSPHTILMNVLRRELNV